MRRTLNFGLVRALTAAVLAASLALGGGRAWAQQPTAPASGETVGEPGRPTLEQRVERLEQAQRDSEAAQEATLKSAPVITVGKSGFALTAADGGFRIRLRGMVHIDGRTYADDDPTSNPDTVTPRRARIILEGTLWKYYDFSVVPEFGDGKTSLLDAYISARFVPEFNLRVGKFKAPVGLERLQGINDLNFLELALPTGLVPNRDVGVMLYGDLLLGSISYAVGVFDGAPDGGSIDKNTDGMYDYDARLFFTPFKTTDLESLSGLGFGVGASTGLHYGSLTAPDVPSYKSAGQMTWFKYNSNAKPTKQNTVVADGPLTRFSPQLHYYFGPFGMMAEYAESSQEVRLTHSQDETLTHTAWQVTAGFVLTGEAASYKSVKPRRVFDPLADSWGAWQVVGRYNEMKIDDDAFPLYANPTASAGMAHGWGAGVTGFLNDNMRVMFDYEETAFWGGALTAFGNVKDRDVEKVWFWRLQLAF